MPHGPLVLVVVSAFFGNAGFGMMWGYVIKRVVDNVGPEDRDRAGSMLPSAQQTAYALGAALNGIIANGLGFDAMTRPEELRTVALWVFAGFMPPAVLGTLIAWRFAELVTNAQPCLRTSPTPERRAQGRAQRTRERPSVGHPPDARKAARTVPGREGKTTPQHRGNDLGREPERGARSARRYGDSGRCCHRRWPTRREKTAIPAARRRATRSTSPSRSMKK